MKPTRKSLALVTTFLMAATTSAAAGPIAKACLKSDRKAATPALCSCIQDVANWTLSRSDQKLAARFFRDPHRAQEIRQSDSRTHERFWQRYKQFGATAEATCKGI